MLTALKDALDARVPALLEEHRVPGVAIAARSAGEVLTAGYGVTSVANPLPVDGATIFQVGSISKTFVGVIAAQLHTEGLLDLDDPVAPLLRDLGGIDHRITTRHLLTHSSGIDAQYMIGSARELLAGGADDSIQASIQHYANDPVMFEPGTDFSYSGPGFMVAGAVIERTLNQRWATILRERVLEPAGMAHTFTTADEVITYRVAAPHDVRGGRVELARNQGWQLGWQLPGWDVPGGGVLSSVDELMKYAEFAWTTAGEHGFFTTLRNRGVPGHDIAHAWMKERRRGHEVLGHNGLTIGYSSRFLLAPGKKVAYASLTNSLQGAPLNTAIERIVWDHLLGPEEPRDVPSPAAPVGVEGVYDCGFYGEVELLARPGDSFELRPRSAPREAGGFVITPPAIPALFPAAPGVLASDPAAELPTHVVPYITDSSGAVTALRIGERIAQRIR